MSTNFGLSAFQAKRKAMTDLASQSNPSLETPKTATTVIHNKITKPFPRESGSQLPVNELPPMNAPETVTLSRTVTFNDAFENTSDTKSATSFTSIL